MDMRKNNRKKSKLFISRFLCCILVLTLTIPLQIYPAYAADTTLVADDFSHYATGPLTIGSGNTWTKEGAVPTVNVVNDTVTGSTYAEISHDLTGSSYIGQRFAAQSGGVIIEFDVNLPTDKGGTLWVMDGKVNATNAAVLRYQLDAGVIKRHNAGSGNQINYDKSHWYRFKLVFNTPEKKYTATITDLTTNETVEWPDAFYSPRERISSFGFFVNAGGGKLNLANVRVTALDLALNSLELKAGAINAVLNPPFDPKISGYTIEVPYSVNELSVHPAASNPGGVSLQVGGDSVSSGGTSIVPLTGSSTDIEAAVASIAYPDIKLTYKVTVNKLEKAPNVDFTATEARDGRVLIGWEEPSDPAYQEARIYLKKQDGSLELVDTVPKGKYISAISGLTNGTSYSFIVKGAFAYEGEAIAESSGVEVSETPVRLPARQMEGLDRGIVAVKESGHVYIGWRMLGTDPAQVAFNLYRDGAKVNASPITNSTNFIDADGTEQSVYFVKAVINGVEQRPSVSAEVWNTHALDIPIQKPADGVTPSGETYTYRANDATAADLDGDGQYEIILKWDPSNSKDNSQSGYTGNTYVDAYKLDGTQLWRIDLGRNIRSGAHYLDIMAYDLDGDGKAEVTFRTADGTIDGQGHVIGDADADYRNSGGYILEGPEFHTVFEGVTGRELATEAYEPERGNVADWGDNYGNRVDRFLAAIAYLDGERPSIIMQRGYYTRMVLVAYNWRDGELTKLWTFDSKTPGNESYAGQGNHQLSVADVDGDGRDEIITGAAAIDDDGTGLWNSRLGHGDAMHVGDLDPNRLGLEMFAVQEDTSVKYSSNMKDAKTGRVLWGQYQTGVDTGRGLSADVDPRYAGAESWSIDGAWNSPTGSMYTAQGEKISNLIPTSNFAVWWDGDLSRELLDHDWQGDPLRVGIPKIDKWDYENNQLIEIERFGGTYSNNDTKGNPVLQADLLGDWREEVIFRTEDSSALRLYTTTDVTEHRIYTLMHDPVYRLGVAWQNTGYNQPPHTGFFLGTGMETPEQPHIYMLSHNEPIIGVPEQPVDHSPSAGAGASSGQPPAAAVGSGTVKQTAAVDANGRAQADIAAADFTKAAESSAGHEVRIEVASNQAAKSIHVSLPAQAVKKAAEQLIERVVIRLGAATITLDKEWIRSNLSESALKVELSVTAVDDASLPAEVREKLGGRQAYDITLIIDGKKPASFAGGVKAELDYIPKAGERANGIVVYYLDDNGGLQIVKNGAYEPSTGKAAFKPEHFSKYAAAYVNVSFHDIGNISWAVGSIESLAARGIVDGVGNDAFKPNQTVTRAQFLKMLMYAFDLADEDAKSTLSDVKEGSWYYSSVAAAQRLGIVQGKADGSFGVNDEVTRQDMAVMAYRAAQQLQIKLHGAGEAVDFADKSAIGSYALEAVEAMQSGGVIQGIGEGRFAPQGHATRAQAAVIIDKLLRLQVR